MGLPARSLPLCLAVLALLLAGGPAPAAEAAAPRVVGACVLTLDGGAVARFDVRVRGRRTVRVARGPRNRVRGGRVAGRLPVRFRPGATTAALRVRFRRPTVTWRLGRRTARLRRDGPACAPAPGKGAPGPAAPGAPGPAPQPFPAPPTAALERAIFSPASFWNAPPADQPLEPVRLCRSSTTCVPSWGVASAGS